MELKEFAKQICSIFKMNVLVCLAFIYRNINFIGSRRCGFVIYKFKHINFFRPKFSAVTTLKTVTLKHLQMQPDISGWCNTAEVELPSSFSKLHAVPY